MIQIAEIKACSNRLDALRTLLLDNKASLKGIDHQIDTYFQVDSGRLKLRQGNIETNLIYYQRANTKTTKKSSVLLYQPNDPVALKDILNATHTTLCVVDKTREIYFIDNVKFHLDTVANLGTFVEIEAIDEKSELDYEVLLAQCNKYKTMLGIHEEDLISVSYSDLIMQTASTNG